MHPQDRKSMGMSAPSLTKGLTWNSASQNVSGGSRKSETDPLMYNVSPSTLPLSNCFQLRGFPEPNVVCLVTLLLPPNVFLFQVFIHSGETDFKQIQVSVPSTPRLGKNYCSEKQDGTVHISGNFCSNVSLQHPDKEFSRNLPFWTTELHLCVYKTKYLYSDTANVHKKL